MTTAHREMTRRERPVASQSGGSDAMVKRERIGLRRSDEESRKEERRVDAKAPYAEEGRGKLRKAPGSRKQAEIRGYPNGGTRREERPVTV